MVQYYGCPSIFFTFAPDDIHSILTLRMCCPTMNGNDKFPAVDDGFEQMLREKNNECSEGNILNDYIDITEFNLHSLVTKNPVAAAQVFKMTTETIFDTLFGIKPEYMTKITVPNSSRSKGIFGSTIAAYTVTEVQGRLSLHGHMTIWCNLSPEIIQQSIKCKKLIPTIKEVILSHIASSIPLKYHVTALSTQATPPLNRCCQPPRRTFFDSPIPNENIVNFHSHVHDVVGTTSVHQHSPTCVKGPRGHMECRLSYPSNCSNGTGITICELKPTKPNNTNKKHGDNKEKNITEIKFEVIPYSNIHFVNIENNYTRNNKPFGLIDNKCIIIELEKEMYTFSQINTEIQKIKQMKEGETLMNIWDTLQIDLCNETKNVIAARNGAVVNYSPTASGTLRCNTAAYHLGGNEQAKATLYYLIKYITKDALSPTTSLSLLSHAREKILAYPSLATDTGTDLRTGQHLVTVMVNKSTSCKEITDTQAASYLQGMPAQYGNVRTSYIFINDARKKTKYLIHRNKITKKKMTKLRQEIKSKTCVKPIVDDNNYDSLNKDEETSEIGGATIYKVMIKNKFTVIPVSQHTHYAYRGKHLAEMSLLEYCCIIEIVPLPTKKNTSTNIPKRRSNTLFAFQVMHPLCTSHAQRIRSKLLIPLLVGGSPKNFNSIDNNNMQSIYKNCSRNEKKKLDNAALYYLTLTSPWTLQKNKNRKSINELIPKDGHTYNHFITYMQKLKSYINARNESNASFLHRCLYSYIVDTSRNMRTKVTNKVMSAMYRARSTDKWDDNHKGPSTYPKKQTVCQSINYWRHKHRCHMTKKSNSLQNESDSDTMENTIEGETRDIMKELQKECQKLTDKDNDDKIDANNYLQHTFTSISKIATYNKVSKKEIRNEIIPNQLSKQIWDIIIDKNNMETKNKNYENDKLNIPEVLHKGNDIFHNYVPEQTMRPTEDQLIALSEFQTYFQTNEQYLIFIHGGPGVGKTWTINEMKKKMDSIHLKHISTAFTGVAASLLTGGETIHSLFHIPVGKKAEYYINNNLCDKAFRKLHETFFDCSCIIIDEISMVGSGMLYKIHKRLQEVMKNNKPFGGKNIIAVGDFFQMVPVGDSCLYQDIIKYLIAPSNKKKNKEISNNKITLNEICKRGADLFTRFTLINLKTQVRASEDIQQMHTLECLRSFNDNQVTDSLLKSIVHNNTLHAKDFEFNTSSRAMSWSSAPLAVTSNNERDFLMFIRAKKWAQENGVPIITWKLQCKGSVMDFVTDDDVLKEIYHHKSGLLGFFVQGAMSYLTENINPSKGLANGSTVYMYSLSFSDEDIKSKEYNSFITQYNECTPGEEIHLKTIIPTFINVELHMTSALQKYWHPDDTIITNKYVVPIGFRSRASKIIIDFKVHNQVYNNVHVIRDKVHRVELSFVITLHKLQGKTMPKIIIELNQRPFPPSITYNGLLVALSRITKRSDLRIMPIKSGTDILYLKKLKPDINLKIWLSGFTKDGIWKKQLCIDYYKHIHDDLNITKNKIKNKKPYSKKLTNKKTILIPNINVQTLSNSNKKENIQDNSNEVKIFTNHSNPFIQKNKLDTEIKMHLKKNKTFQTKTENIMIMKDTNIIDLLGLPDDDNLTSEFFNSQWRQIYATYIENYDTNELLHPHENHIWELSTPQMQITDLYYTQAETMQRNNLINVFMPNYMTKYTHEPEDVISLKRQNWLTGTIIDLFLIAIDVDIVTGSQNNKMNILPTSFYATLTNTLDDDARRPAYNTYNFEAISQYTNHYMREDFLKCGIIPVHVRNHWLLCIIDPLHKTIYVIDSLRKNNTTVIANIIQWYQTELMNHNYDIIEHNVNAWNIITSVNLPSTVPRQRDGSSCGIFVVMTAYYWYQFRRLPHNITDWNEENVNSRTPNLRHFVLHQIIHTIYLENKRLLDIVL